MKRCKVCKVKKEIDQFYKIGMYRSPVCKECKKASLREKRREQKELIEKTKIF